MNPTTQLATLIASATGAVLHFYDGAEAIDCGAAEWIEGRGLLFAEKWAEHQGHVHLLAAAGVLVDGPDLDFWNEADGLMATLAPGLAIDAGDVESWQARVASESWQRFWASQIAQARA